MCVDFRAFETFKIPVLVALLHTKRKYQKITLNRSHFVNSRNYGHSTCVKTLQMGDNKQQFCPFNLLIKLRLLMPKASSYPLQVLLQYDSRTFQAGFCQPVTTQPEALGVDWC